MSLPDLIAFLPLMPADSSRLIVLKSRFNRYAARLNAARFSPYGQAERELLVQLEYLKKQIEAYH